MKPSPITPKYSGASDRACAIVNDVFHLDGFDRLWPTFSDDFTPEHFLAFIARRIDRQLIPSRDKSE